MFHYLIQLNDTDSLEIKFATVLQNIFWNKEKCWPTRIEYLGEFITSDNELIENLLLTSYSKPISQVSDIDNILSVFFDNLGFDNEDKKGMLISGCFQINSSEVKAYYDKLIGRIDDDWFRYVDFEDPTQRANYFKDVKGLYYDYNLEFMLYEVLRDEYETYMKGRQPPLMLTTSQNEFIEKKEMKANMLGKRDLPWKMEQNTSNGIEIIYGKYHVYHIEQTSHQVDIIAYENQKLGIKTRIVDFAFDGCNNLESINFIGACSEFGEFVFRNCTNLKKVTLNEKMKTIPPNTFVNCTALEKLMVPSSVKIIGEHAFHYCISLNTLEFLENTQLEKIENGVFVDCLALAQIKVPKSVKEIGDWAFSGSGLEGITIPESVVSIGSSVFMECRKLESVEFYGKLAKIPDGCFSECTKLKSIRFPNGLSEIGDSAFSGCKELERLEISQNVTKIGDDVFKDCINLKEVVFPESVITIGSCDFDKDTIVYCKKNSYVHNRAIDEEWNFQLI